MLPKVQTVLALTVENVPFDILGSPVHRPQADPNNPVDKTNQKCFYSWE